MCQGTEYVNNWACQIDKFIGAGMMPRPPRLQNCLQIVCKSIRTVFLNYLKSFQKFQCWWVRCFLQKIAFKFEHFWAFMWIPLIAWNSNSWQNKVKFSSVQFKNVFCNNLQIKNDIYWTSIDINTVNVNYFANHSYFFHHKMLF